MKTSKERPANPHTVRAKTLIKLSGENRYPQMSAMETLKPGGTAKKITLLRPLDNCLGRSIFLYRKHKMEGKRC